MDSGLSERTVLISCPNASERYIRSKLKRAGKSPEKIASYLRGWNQVKSKGNKHDKN